MPRPTHAISNKTIDGGTRPMSPRYGGLHGSAGPPHGNLSGTPRAGIGPTTNARRGGTPLSSPRAFPPSPGTMRGGSARDPQAARGARVDLRAPSPQGVGGKTRKGIEADVDGNIGLEATGEDSGRIRVAVRVRPFSEKEKLAGTRCVISMAGSQTMILDPAFFDSEGGASSSEDRSMWERTFSFDHSFWSHSSSGYELGESGASFSSQADVHQALGEFLLHNACRGFNCSLFAYGQTGSGKTYTMLGDSSDLTSAAGEGTAGLIPRMCIELFQRVGISGDGTGGGGFVDDTHSNGQASVQVSFCEIYNEQVRDLFGSGGSGHSLRVREHPTRGAFVEGLSARQVTCYQQVQDLLEDGMSARATAATAMNEVSSRSHAIFTIYITVTFTTKLSNGTGKGVRPENGVTGDDVSSRTSKICLVDLAGSERANATGAKGDRLREAANINKSLSTLSDVIKALAKRGESGRASNGSSSSNESYIPYRNSMLTWLLKDSIGGNSKTVMLAAISPVADAYQETMSTLRYVERAKEIVNSIAVNDASANPLIGKLREEVRGLQELLEKREAVIAEHKEKEALLTAELETARVDGGDAASQALAAADAAADSLHAALQTEKKERAESAAAAAAMAAEVNRCHRLDLDKEGEAHAAAFDELAKRYQEDLRQVSEEAEEVLADELARGKQYAMEEERRFRREWEDAAEVERVRVAEAHRSEMAALAEQHRKETERILAEATDNVASTADSAEATISMIREKHKVEIAQVKAVEEAKRVDEVRILREEFHREKETAEGEAREAQTAADAERESKNREAIAEAVATTKAAALKDLDDLRAQHDAAFTRLSEAHSVAVRAAVDEASERLRLEHENALAASVAAVEATHKAQTEEAQRLADERATAAASAMAVLKTAHEESTRKLEEENAKALVQVKGDADARYTADVAAATEKSAALVTAAKDDSAKCLEALKAVQKKELRALNESHQMEILRAADTETQRAEAKLAAAAAESRAMVNIINAESAATLATLKHEHREEIKAIREQSDRESLEDVAKHEEQILNAKDHSAKEMADVEARHQQEFTEAEKRWQDEAERVTMVAEEHRTACIKETERRLTACLTTAKAEAAAALTSEEDRHREELRTEIGKVRAEAEERRVADLATSAGALSRALDEARAEQEAALLAAEKNHREELERCNQEHQEELHRYTIAAKMEREKRDSDAADAAASQDARLRDEMERIGREHKNELDRALEKVEEKHDGELSALQDKLALSLAEAKTITDTSISNLGMEHEAKLAKLEKDHKAQVTLAAEVARNARSADLAAAADESARAKEQFEAEAASKLTVLKEKHRREVARVREDEEGKRRAISSAAEEQASAERARVEATIKELKVVHEEELARLCEENISNADAAAARSRKQRDADLEAAETRFKASADSISAEAAKDKAALVETHLLELRKIQAEGTDKVELVFAEAATRREAQEKEATNALNELQLTHRRQLQAATTERDQAVAAVGAAVEESEKALEAREREYREDLQKVRMEKDAERLRDIDKALAEAQSSFEEKLSSAIGAEETKYVAALTAERDSHSEALNAAEETRVEAENEANSQLTALEEEHRIAFESLKEAHRAAVEDLEDSRRREVEEFDRRVDAAETATADALASADELATRAAALDEMLKASVGSKEQELAGHRSRVAQLQAFVARREASISSLDTDEAADADAGGDGDGDGGIQGSARRSVQQRVIDLRAMAAGAGVGGLQVGSDDTGFAAFAGAGLVEGLTLEKYAEELEVVLVRATVEAAVARQDHLEAELQFQGVTRQLVGLKLVHAQLRENLEDTQVKLEYKSQSAARRLLNSAARLAYEFAKPDRFSGGSGGSTRSALSKTAPRAMSSQNSGNRSPLSRVRGEGSRRGKTPPRQRGSTGNTDFGKTC